MKLAVINGNERHGSTWNIMDTVRKALDRYGDVETTEFYLPKDMPHFCRGCFSCFMHGEQTCPHAASVQPIVTAMLGADVIVLTSPVYGLDVSGQMKALLDHLCYMWVSHRPNPRMFSKIGLTITTTAGAGLKHTSKTMRDSLNYWGVLRVLSLAMPVSAMKWSDVQNKKRAHIEKKAERIAKRIAGYVRRAGHMRQRVFFRIFFALMQRMMRHNDWSPYDRKHWENQGWVGPTPSITDPEGKA